MNCPDKQKLQELIDGELSTADLEQVARHIQDCDSCKEELRDIYRLQNAISQIIDEDNCPSLDELEKYAAGECAAERAAEIEEHIDLCGMCRTYVWAFQASPDELADWQVQEEQAYEEFQAKELGYDAARKTLSKLLPAKIDIVDKIGQCILKFVLDIREKTIDSWPTFNQEARLAGVLGFTEADPQTEAASIIMATTLYIAQGVSNGDIAPSDIEAKVKEVAVKLGAGKELQKRLVETLPPLVLDSK